jgi:glycosyltransferase involved in cell wall biosynthesis
MRVLLTCEARFERAADGTIWAPAAYGAALWSRYLDVFSSVLVAARVADVKEPSPGSVQASGPGIGFCALRPYSGFMGLVLNSQSVHAAVTDGIRRCPAVVVRSPSPAAYIAATAARAMGRPYGAEVVGDPDQVFSAGAFSHPLRVPLRRAAAVAQKRLALNATAALFVTRHVLQRKYPTRGATYAASDAALDDAAFGAASPRVRPPSEAFTLVTVGALDQPYKGTAVLLEAVRELRHADREVRLLVVGGGALLPALAARAHALGLEPAVEFLGAVDREGVRRALDSADLFVLPSFTEGLPRALLEAMARGLAAVATEVGGVPELLTPDCLVAPRDARALAARIRQVMENDRLRNDLAARNRQVARAYHERVQTPIRTAFLAAVRQACSLQHAEPVCA